MYQPIATSAPGIVVGERFPLQARVMDRLALVRSVHHENGIHAPSAHWMQTGYFGPTLARNAPQKPSFESVISAFPGATASADAGLRYRAQVGGVWLPGIGLPGQGLQSPLKWEGIPMVKISRYLTSPCPVA